MGVAEYPYVNHMNVLYKPLELVDVPALVKACKDGWYNQTLCQVNNSVICLGIVQGEYHWHKHDREAEFFFVLQGRLLVDIENGQSIELDTQQGCVVPLGVVHRTRAAEKTVMLMVENAGIVPTGDV